jgi:hypothetical protein
MKKKMAILLFSVLVLFTFAGCNGNLFMEWGLETPPEFNAGTALSNDNVMDYIDTMKTVLEFPDGLSDEDAQTAYDSLMVFASTAEPEEKQAAAAAAGELKILSDQNSTDLVNNFANLIASFSDESQEPTFEDVITALVPGELLNDQIAFTATVEKLQAAADAFALLGTSLGDDGVYEYEPSDSEKADIAQMAVIAMVVDAAVTEIGISELFNVANGAEYTGDDPLNQLESTSTSSLYNILSWAGLDTVLGN